MGARHYDQNMLALSAESPIGDTPAGEVGGDLIAAHLLMKVRSSGSLVELMSWKCRLNAKRINKIA